MTTADLRKMLELVRGKTLSLLAEIETANNPAEVLSFRPGLGRAHVAWQLMHLAATDDRHLNVRMKASQPANPEYVRRFAGGSTPDDAIPSLAEVRAYLTETRAAMLAHLDSLTADDLLRKPQPESQWTYADWFPVLIWHEAHHHGQAHLSLNMYRANHPEFQKTTH